MVSSLRHPRAGCRWAPVPRPHQPLPALLFHRSVLPAAVCWGLSSFQGLSEERVAGEQPRASGLLCPLLPPVPAAGTSGSRPAGRWKVMAVLVVSCRRNTCAWVASPRPAKPRQKWCAWLWARWNSSHQPAGHQLLP